MKKGIMAVTLVLGMTLAAGSFTEAAAQQKWSSRKKGAVIGGAVGAGTGAVVGRKKAKSAVIGGAVGAGAGYLIGRHRDKKKGRVH